MFRIGQSQDFHKIDKSKDLILGGLTLKGEPGLLGHSDADVLTHVITEAIMGAAGLGDLGTLFPDTDKTYKGIDSTKLLKDVLGRIEKLGYKVVNIDTLIICETTKISKYRLDIVSNLKKIIGIDAINVKATTMEGCGPIGNKEGIAAQAIVLLSAK